MGFFFQATGDKGKNIISSAKEALDPNKQVTDTSKLISALGGAASVAVSIAGSLSNATEEIIKMDKRAASLVRNMGLTSNSSLILKRELATAAIDIIKAGGDAETGLAVAQEILKTTNKNAMVSGEIIADINATSKVTGQSAGALQSAFSDIGRETSQISEEMKTVLETSTSMGVNAQAVSNLVVSNLEKMNKFGFPGGVKGLAEMAAKSAALRIDMTQVFSLAEDLLSPEKAIEVASAFQRLGASSSALADPLKLMDMAQNNVPELQNELAKLTEKYTYFDEKTKTFNIMPGSRRELMQISKEIGVSYENLTKMSIEGAKLKEKMSQISFDGLDFSDEQKQQIAQMAELKKNEKTGKMEYFVKFKDEKGEVQDKAFSELGKSQESLKSFLDNQKEMMGKSMQDIAVDQLGYAERSLKQLEALNMGIATLAAGSKGADDFLKGVNKRVTDTFGEATKPYSASEMKANFQILDSSSEKLAEAADYLMNGDLVKAMESINASNSGTVDLLNKLVVNPIKEGGITDMTSLSKAMETFFPGFSTAANSIVSVLKSVFDIDDFIAVNGQIGKLNEGDLVLGGTKMLPPKQPTNVEDTKTALSSFTQEQLKTGGTTANVNNNTNVSGDMTLTLKIDAPGVTQQMAEAIKTQIEKSPELIINTIKNRMDLTLPTGVKKV
jgi:hypothetical protein